MRWDLLSLEIIIKFVTTFISHVFFFLHFSPFVRFNYWSSKSLKIFSNVELIWIFSVVASELGKTLILFLNWLSVICTSSRGYFNVYACSASLFVPSKLYNINVYVYVFVLSVVNRISHFNPWQCNCRIFKCVQWILSILDEESCVIIYTGKQRAHNNIIILYADKNSTICGMMWTKMIQKNN